MAYYNSKVLLGFVDEAISEKFKNQVNFTTNKIGGKPDLPPHIKLEGLTCPLCQLPKPLILQIYAPLENKPNHRTLYLFACINPNCWNHNESWTCIRMQTSEIIVEDKRTSTAIDWGIDEADNWGEDNIAITEENGNLLVNMERISDEDDESCSFEEAIKTGFENLTMDDRNANNEALGGAVGQLHSPSATAEIEGDEGEVISIDSPTRPVSNIIALMQEVTPLPPDLCQNIQPSNLKKMSLFQFLPHFINVWEETINTKTVGDSHVRELLQDYQQRNKDDSNVILENNGASANLTENICEKYEKSNPAHGDKMFHHFLSRIQMNPGQILRYGRDKDLPLLIHPLQEIPKTCKHCQGETIFEFQILPTIIPKLKLAADVKDAARLEFGTVLVFTCRNSCWTSDSNLKYESVVLQSEIY